ncbi:MAG: alpha/beta hydrolase [Hydrococcus sp. Prado102]|jgi:pimeloyl-ACP methyl ester carboxylesterase|nr:alpha/beta hydrolase [Hydrococcus sp. Prado102]
MPEIKSRLSFILPTPLKPELPLFIFLPGMDGTGLLYQRQADRLAKFFDIRCLAIPSDDLSNWDTLAKEAVKLIKIEVESRAGRTIRPARRSSKVESKYSSLSSEGCSPVYLCGESFGGCLALKLVLEEPSLFERLILINPSSSFNQRPLLGLGIQVTQWMPSFLHPASAMGLLPFLAALERISAGDRMALFDAMNSVPPRVVSWRLNLLKDFSVAQEDLRRITQPTLILAGQNDRLLPSIEEAKRLVSYIPNAKTVVLPHGGHACLLESDVFLDEIMQAKNFLVPNVLSDVDRAAV